LEIIMEQNMRGDTSGSALTATGAKVQSGVGHASDVAHKKIESVADAAQPAVDSLSEGAHIVVDKVAGAAAQAAQTVEKSGQYLKAGEERMVQVTRTYVHENPVTALAMAVGAGFLISRLLSSR
jgi:ElaB/YqjD/DUF883 family membrane-anchored ribosome-binding protein